MRAILIALVLCSLRLWRRSRRRPGCLGRRAIHSLHLAAPRHLAPDADSIHKRPLVIKVANDPAARPQSGMAQADLVLEIPVEGGITRYALVFQSQDPSMVGPVRSARQSDLNYLPALHAILAHVGASESVTQMVRDAAKSGSFVDIDEFQHADAFERVAGKVGAVQRVHVGERSSAARPVRPERARVDVPALQFDATAGKAAGKDAASLTIPYTGAGKVTYAFDAGHVPPHSGRSDDDGRRREKGSHARQRRRHQDRGEGDSRAPPTSPARHPSTFARPAPERW